MAIDELERRIVELESYIERAERLNPTIPLSEEGRPSPCRITPLFRLLGLPLGGI
jgi:hypothetical protein